MTQIRNAFMWPFDPESITMPWAARLVFLEIVWLLDLNGRMWIDYVHSQRLVPADHLLSSQRKRRHRRRATGRLADKVFA